MEKPAIPPSSRVPPPPNQSPSPLLSATTTDTGDGNNQQQKVKPPTPEELVAHYQSQGLDSNEAPLKAIEDLQAFLHSLLARRAKKQTFMADTLRKLDIINTRLAVLEMKLDSKPGYPQTLAIGISAVAAIKGAGCVVPHVVEAIGQMWSASRRRS